MDAFIDMELLMEFLKAGTFCIGFGMIVIVPLEVLVFGIMKAVRLLKP